MRAKFINEKFQEKSDPIVDMNIGRPRYAQNIFNQFKKDIFERFLSLRSIILKEEEDFYIEIPLDGYSNYGMNKLEATVKKLIREKYKGKLKDIDDKFLQKYYKGKWPDESPLYNIDENILIKII